MLATLGAGVRVTPRSVGSWDLPQAATETDAATMTPMVNVLWQEAKILSELKKRDTSSSHYPTSHWSNSILEKEINFEQYFVWLAAALVKGQLASR